jgi:hypothetical protein
MISHQRSLYKREFIFLGANQDAIAEGKKTWHLGGRRAVFQGHAGRDAQQHAFRGRRG